MKSFILQICQIMLHRSCKYGELWSFFTEINQEYQLWQAFLAVQLTINHDVFPFTGVGHSFITPFLLAEQFS